MSFGGDVTRDPQRGLVQVRRAAPPSCTDPKWCSVAASTVAAVKNSRRIMCCGTSRDRWVARAERAALHLGQPERRVVGGDDHVGVADQADAAAHAEAVDRGDHRHRALVAPRGTPRSSPRLASMSAVKPSVFCISLMSTPALKPAALSSQDHRRGSGWSRPAAVMASASSNQPRDGIALTGG